MHYDIIGILIIKVLGELNMLTFGRMRPEQRRDCSLLAARSQQDYVYLTTYISEENRRRKFLERALDIEVKINDGSTICLTASEDNTLVAMAMLCPPGVHRPSVASYLKAGFWKAFWYGGVRDSIAWTIMDDKAGAPCHKLAENAWYLSLLSVDPKKQGQGIGSRSGPATGDQSPGDGLPAVTPPQCTEKHAAMSKQISRQPPGDFFTIRKARRTGRGP